MKTVNIHEAKTHLSRLLARVAKGERVVIARNGVPIAELRAVSPEPVVRHFGELKGKVQMSDDFNDPLPAEIQKYFDGERG